MLPASAASDVYTRFTNPSDSTVMVIAHRGDWHGTMENSLHALLKAAQKGAQISDLNLQRTADGEIICFSDPTVDRLTYGSGSVSTFTLDSLRAIPVRNYSGGNLEAIPTLAEAIGFAGDGMMLSFNPKSLQPEVERLVSDLHAEDKVIFTGPQRPADGMLWMPIVDLDADNSLSTLGRVLADGANAVQLRYSDDNNPRLADAYAMTRGRARVCIDTHVAGHAGSHADVTPQDNPDTEWGDLIRDGATIILSDQIKPLLRYLGSDR